MCGIYCQIGCCETQPISIHDYTKQLLVRRGPQSQKEHFFRSNDYHAFFLGSVLWHQGDTIAEQPAILGNHVLLWNGDIFSDEIDSHSSDTEYLLTAFSKCETEDEIFKIFRCIKGPYSFIYFNMDSKRLYFGRDIYGRHSLLLGKCDNGDVVISSVLGNAGYIECIEVPAAGIFILDMNNSLDEQQLYLKPWQICDTDFTLLEQIFDKKLSILSVDETPEYLIKQIKYFKFNFERELSETYSGDMDPHSIFKHLLEKSEIVKCVMSLSLALSTSVKRRINTTKSECGRCLMTETPICNHSRFGILFSGGIDCTILAILADRCFETTRPIDLLNVSFEKVNRSSQSKETVNFDTPDRLSARQALIELKRICPTRKWNLVEINVTREELAQSASRIAHVAYPLNTILDESLASVLHFASQGATREEAMQYRIHLIGSGADELFGGYTRHRNAFKRRDPHSLLTGTELLEKELESDFKRLPSRNLARDDRIVSDLGITLRAPYLDEDVVSFVRGLSAYQKCFLAMEHGIGDKLLLRLLGYSLGLREICALKKRAMQFGSRIANPKENASDISKSMTNSFCSWHNKQLCSLCM